MRRARAVDVSVTAGRDPRRVGRAAARLRPGRAAAGGRPARRAAGRWRRTPTCAATRCRRCERGERGSVRRGDRSVSRLRSARLRGDPGDLRAGRLHRAGLPRGRRRAAARRARACPGPAPRLRGRPAARHQRRGDRAARRALRCGCSTRPSSPALRLGLYELLFADATPDHAAVDQAVELVKGAGAAHACRPGQRGAAARRPRARRADRRRCSTTTRLRSAPRSPTRRRSGWRGCGGRSWAPATPARCSPPATSRPRSRCASTLLRHRPRGGPRGAAARRACEVRGRRRTPWPLAAAGDDRRGGADRRGRRRAGRRRRADAAEPRLRGRGRGARSRSPASTSSTSAPGPGSRPARSRRGWATAARRSRSSSTRPGRPRWRRRRGGSGCAASPWSRPTRRRRTMAPGFDRVLVDAPCSDLGALASRPDARWRKSPRAIERLAGVQRRILARAAAALRPGGVLVYATCTISRRENEDRSRRCWRPRPPARSPPLSRRGPRRPRPGARLAARLALPAAAPRSRSARRASSSAA